MAYRAMNDDMIVDLAKMTWREGDYPDHGTIEVTVPCYEKALDEQTWDPSDGDYTGVGSRTVQFVGTANGVKAERIK